MAITEEARHELFQRFEEVFGHQVAVTFMEHLPPIGAVDLATTADVDELGANLRTEMADLRGELRGEMADLRGDLRGEMADLRMEMRTEFGAVRVEIAQLDTRFVEMFGSFKDELHAELRTANRQVTLALIAAIVTMVIASVGMG